MLIRHFEPVLFSASVLLAVIVKKMTGFSWPVVGATVVFVLVFTWYELTYFERRE